MGTFRKLLAYSAGSSEALFCQTILFNDISGLLQGSTVHIYVDFEYDPRLNRDKNPDTLVDNLSTIINRLLGETYDVQIDRENSVELDSSRGGRLDMVD